MHPAGALRLGMDKARLNNRAFIVGGWGALPSRLPSARAKASTTAQGIKWFVPWRTA